MTGSIMLNNNMIVEIVIVITISQLVMVYGTLNLHSITEVLPPLLPLLRFMETTMEAIMVGAADVDNPLQDHQVALVLMDPQDRMEKQEYLAETDQTPRDPPPHPTLTGASSVRQENQEGKEFKEERDHQVDQEVAGFQERKDYQELQDPWAQLGLQGNQEIQDCQEEKEFQESSLKLKGLKDLQGHQVSQDFLVFKANQEMMDIPDVMALQEKQERMEFQVHRVNRVQKDTQVQMEMPVFQADATTVLPRGQLPDTNVTDGDLFQPLSVKYLCESLHNNSRFFSILPPT